MPTSDWEDWLLRAVERADPAGIAAWYLGCNGFILKGADGTTLFIDPYLGTGDPPRTVRMIPIPFDPTDVREADAILATHEHTDHVHGPSQQPILESTGASFIGPAASQAVLDEEEWAIPNEQRTEVSVGTTLSIGGFEVSVLAANDPDAEEPVSYLFEYDDNTFFHAGDSRPEPGFSEIGEEFAIDVAAIAFGSVGMIPDKQTREPKRTRWYNDENQIVEAANALQATRLVPTHWDMWRGLTADPTALHHHVHSFEVPKHLEVTRIGDRIDLPH
ncbi:MAG: MBL fold metallo-hydrolase [Natrialbaceae archaeon]|nr:MBL fold metallo-hydrolase [Natrialbaceae archaeon]